MKIEQIISDAAVKAVKALYGIEAAPGTTVPQKTKKEFEGNLTLVVFPFLKASHKAPEATAQEIGEYLLANEPAVASFNVIKGFLNLVIAPSFWSQMLHHIDEEADFGTHKAAADAPLVMVEYSSPNTNKPLHLGHVRNNLLGYSLSEILKANGNRVVKTNIVNDRGIHICKSMLAWQKWGDGVTPEKAGKKGDHLIGDFYVLFDKHYKQELKELEESLKHSSLPEKAEEILGINVGGENETSRFVWCGVTYTDGFGVSGQAIQFMTQVFDGALNIDKLRGKKPADTRYMGTALYKTVDKNGKQVTKRIIVVTAEAK